VIKINHTASTHIRTLLQLTIPIPWTTILRTRLFCSGLGSSKNDYYRLAFYISVVRTSTGNVAQSKHLSPGHWVRQTTITALAKSFHSKPPLSPNTSLSMTGAKPITPVSSTNSGTMAWHYQRLHSGEIDIRKGQNVCLSRHCYRNPTSHWPYVYGGPVEGASSPRHVVVQDGRPRAQ
jgi:hypothetical protein